MERGKVNITAAILKYVIEEFVIVLTDIIEITRVSVVLLKRVRITRIIIPVITHVKNLATVSHMVNLAMTGS